MEAIADYLAHVGQTAQTRKAALVASGIVLFPIVLLIGGAGLLARMFSL